MSDAVVTPLGTLDEQLESLPYILPPSVHAPSAFESMAGVNTKVIFEFPSELDNDKSAYILMDSIITLSYSVYRAKIPVIPVGESSVSGFALGTRTVAGSIIKIIKYTDELSEYMKFYKGDAIAHRNSSKNVLDGRKNQITQKEFINSIMRDDLTPFNIHSYSISEYTGKIMCDSIYGVTILNNSQVHSIENLITENVISFIAHSVDQNYDPSIVVPSIPSKSTSATGSALIRAKLGTTK